MGYDCGCNNGGVTHIVTSTLWCDSNVAFEKMSHHQREVFACAQHIVSTFTVREMIMGKSLDELRGIGFGRIRVGTNDRRCG